MKVLHVVGARPNFMKAAPVHRALADLHRAPLVARHLLIGLFLDPVAAAARARARPGSLLDRPYHEKPGSFGLFL